MMRKRGQGPATRHRRPATVRRPRLGTNERRRLIQLGVSLAVFFTVFLGRGVFPQQTDLLRDRLGEVLTRSVDFREAFASLGEALTGEEPVLEAVGAFCAQVFGAEDPGTALPEGTEPVLQAERRFLATGPTGYEMACRRLWVEPVPSGDAGEEEPAGPAPEESSAAPLPAGAVVESADDGGQPPPEGCTLDTLSLGTLSWTDPLQGTVTSPFGYREHPVYGEEAFHKGLDIAAEKGTQIAAFAAGTVEYTGESTTYGLYFQIDHGDGIRSLYAHCDSLLVQKGDTVAAGQPVAAVGDTGNATGSHLHFELSVGGVKVDPARYLWQS